VILGLTTIVRPIRINGLAVAAPHAAFSGSSCSRLAPRHVARIAIFQVQFVELGDR